FFNSKTDCFHLLDHTLRQLSPINSLSVLVSYFQGPRADVQRFNRISNPMMRKSNPNPSRKPRSYSLPALCTSYICTLESKNETMSLAGAMIPCQSPAPARPTCPVASG